MNIVEFPGLWGLSIPINPVALSFGIIKINWYGIIIAAAFMLAVILAMRSSRHFGINDEDVIDLVLVAAPVAVICARLYYVVFKWEDYKYDLTEIYKVWHGGLAIYGGILGALISAYLFARHKKIPFLKLFDFAVPYLAMAQGIGRWGNFINQEAFGTNTTLPWGMTSGAVRGYLEDLRLAGMNVNPDIPVHPAFLYESIWDIGIFAFLIWYRKRKKFEGEVFFLYMALYGLGRAFIEGIRTDSLMLGNLRISQVLAFIFATAFGIMLIIHRRKVLNIQAENVETGTSEFGAVLKYVRESEAVIDNEELNKAHEEETVERNDGNDVKEQNTENEGIDAEI